MQQIWTAIDVQKRSAPMQVDKWHAKYTDALVAQLKFAAWDLLLSGISWHMVASTSSTKINLQEEHVKPDPCLFSPCTYLYLRFVSSTS